jgi:photosystem II stability/assembly factor-like uncharacterized protein
MSVILAGLFAASLAGLAAPAGATLGSGDESPQQLSMLTPSLGFGLFETGGGAMCTAFVARTRNGARSFQPAVEVQSWQCGGAWPDDEMAFDGHGDGFVWGNGLYVTHDGGRVWRRLHEAGDVLQVTTVARSVWAIEAVCGTSHAATCPMRVLRSPNGGRTWGRAPSQPKGAVGWPWSVDGQQPESWLVRASAATAFVVSHPVVTDVGAAEQVPLFVTDDGGRSWVRRSIPCAAGTQNVSLDAAPTGSLVAVCASGESSGSQTKSTSTSGDEGRTWNVQLACQGPGAPAHVDRAAAPLCNGYLGEVVALTGKLAFETGDRSPLNVTHNGGRSWTSLTKVGDTSGEPAEVQFLDARHGVVLGQSTTGAVTVWHTSDAGAHWRAARVRQAVLRRT